MLGRPKTVSGDAKRTTIHLNPGVNFALNLIENNRRIRREGRYQPSDIIEDALWFYAEKVKGKTREQLTAMLAEPESNDAVKKTANLRQFPKPKKS